MIYTSAWVYEGNRCFKVEEIKTQKIQKEAAKEDLLKKEEKERRNG